MSERKQRKDALPPEEKARRDRESWAKSRAKTGNWSSRAYNLAIQDAARWVREEHPDLWEDFYQARCAEQKAKVEGGVLTECSHDIIEQVTTTVESLLCKGCSQIMGSSQPGVAPAGYKLFRGDGGRVTFCRVDAQ